MFRRIEQRDDLSAEEKLILEEAVDRTAVAPAGSDIVREGDRPTRSTILLEGLAVRYRVLRNGSRQLTSIHVPGDFVDLQSFPLQLMDHSVGALSECSIATIPHTALERIRVGYPHLGWILWRLSLLDAAVHREWIVAMGGMPAVGHLAHLFCEMYLRMKVIGFARDYTFSLPMTQTELAEALGLSPIHVNRVLQELRSNGVIAFDGKTAKILDWDRLVDIGEFDDKHLHLHDGPRTRRDRASEPEADLA